MEPFVSGRATQGPLIELRRFQGTAFFMQRKPHPVFRLGGIRRGSEVYCRGGRVAPLWNPDQGSSISIGRGFSPCIKRFHMAV